MVVQRMDRASGDDAGAGRIDRLAELGEDGGRVREDRVGVGAPAEEVERRAELAPGDRRAVQIAQAHAAVGDLPPHRHRLPQLPGELEAATEARECGDANGIVVVTRPELQRLASGARRVPVGVHRAEALGRLEQERHRAVRLARREGMACDQLGRGPGRLEELGEPRVQRSPASPGRLLVERLTRERMPECRMAVSEVEQQAARERAFDAVVALELLEQGEVDGRSDRRGRLESSACRRLDPVGTCEDGIADRVRQRNAAAGRELEALPDRRDPAVRAQGVRELLHEERHALRAVPDRGRERRPRLLAQHERHQHASASLVERLDRELGEPSSTAELRPRAPERVAARQLVAAVGADDEQRHAGRQGGQRGQHLDRGCVRPVQIVEEHERRARGRKRRERGAQSLHERRSVAAARRVAELGQQGREVRTEVRQALRGVRFLPECRAQRLDHWPVRRRAALARRGLDEHRPRVGERLARQPGLADSGLAGQQHKQAAAVDGVVDQRPQLRQRPVASDQRHVHHPSSL
jgi:hypothetical protein